MFFALILLSWHILIVFAYICSISAFEIWATRPPRELRLRVDGVREGVGSTFGPIDRLLLVERGEGDVSFKCDEFVGRGVSRAREIERRWNELRRDLTCLFNDGVKDCCGIGCDVLFKEAIVEILLIL